MTAHSCTDHGHVWLETDGTPYTRHRGRTQADVTCDVICKHCKTPAQLPRFAAFSGKRQPGQPIDRAIPPAFKAVMDRAMIETPKTNPGPVPKSE